MVAISIGLCWLGAIDTNFNVGSVDSAQIWRIEKRCPINSLYIALRCHGCAIVYADLDKDLQPSKNGCSLLELRDCALRHGMQGAVVRATPEELGRQSLPVIAHWEEEKYKTGHYVVVTAVGDQAVEYIDGTTAMIDVLPIPDFCKRWTGHLLVFEKSSWRDWLYPSALVLGALTIVLAGIERVRMLYFSRQSGKDEVQASATEGGLSQ